MPSDEPTKQSGAQPAKGDEVPPELKETENSTSTKGTDPGTEHATDSVSYGEGEQNVESANLAS